MFDDSKIVPGNRQSAVPSLTSLSSSSGMTPKNKTAIKPVTRSAGRTQPTKRESAVEPGQSVLGQSQNMSNIGVPSLSSARSASQGGQPSASQASTATAQTSAAAAAPAQTSGNWWPSNPDRTTGLSEDGSTMVYYDPVTRQMKAETVDDRTPAGLEAFREANNLGYYRNLDGEIVLGVRPQYSERDSDGTIVERSSPPTPGRTPPATNGMNLPGRQPDAAAVTTQPGSGQPAQGGGPATGQTPTGQSTAAPTQSPAAPERSGNIFDEQGRYVGPGSDASGQAANNDPNRFVGTLGDGPTDFNPGMTNPDGSNSTVPRGSRDGSSPAVYSMEEQDPDLIALVDQDARSGIEALVNNTKPFTQMPEWQQEKVLNAVQGLVAQGRFDWNKLASNKNFRDAYVERFGDPVQSSVGATQNTRNPDGSVQGQFEGERGGTYQAIADNAAAMDDMVVERTDKSTAEQNDRTVGQDELSSERMANILRQDSALMQLAAQDGVEMANRAGLRNSSLAAGAQQAAMARAAEPLAIQEADVFNQTGLQNQTLESARREFNAAQEQQNNQFNAANENAATATEFTAESRRRDNNAARETNVSINNAGMANDMTNADRQRDFGYELQQLAGDQDYAKQQLAAQTAADVANIEGSYKQLISENDTAARMFDSYYQTVQSVIGNAEFTQAEAQGRVNAARQEFEAGMEMILGFESFDLQNTDAEAGGEIPASGRPAADQTGVPNGFTRMEFPWGVTLLPTNVTGVTP